MLTIAYFPTARAVGYDRQNETEECAIRQTNRFEILDSRRGRRSLLVRECKEMCRAFRDAPVGSLGRGAKEERIDN